MSPNKGRLGRGLDSLISRGAGAAPAQPASPPPAPAATKAAPTTPTSAVAKAAPAPAATVPTEMANPVIIVEGLRGYREVAVAAIEPNPRQPRKEFDPALIQELAESLRLQGLLQPVVVRTKGEGKYQLIAGERRWRAATSLGWKHIAARVVEADDASSAVLSLIENLQRENLNPVEEALGFASLMKDFGLTQDAVAERVGKQRPTVANALRLLTLPREVQAMLSKGLLSTGHAKALLGLEDDAARLSLAKQIVEEGLSVRQAEALVRAARKPKATPAAAPTLSREQLAVLKEAEKALGSRLAAKVRIEHQGKRGEIRIPYDSPDDLQRLLQKLGG